MYKIGICRSEYVPSSLLRLTNMRFKLTQTQFRIGLVLLGLTVIFYATLTAYDILDHGQHPVNKEKLQDSINVVINRQFFEYMISHLRDTPFPGVELYTQYVLTRSGLKPIYGVQALIPDFGPVVNDVTSFRYPIDIPPCQIAVTHRTSLFVAIISAPNYFEKRNVIRETWLRHLQMQSDSGSKLKLVGFGFIVGLTEDRETQTRIETESATHGDILQVDKMDGYYNLTQKVVGLMNWMNDHCSKVDFVLKVDDDVYVNVRNLATVVTSLDPFEPSVYGTAADGIVRREGKFYVSLEDWPWSSYPVYSMGASLLMPGSAIGPLLAAIETTPYFPFDDTYLIGLCTEKAGIKVRLCDSMLVGLTTSLPKPCQVYNAITWLTNSSDTLNKSHRATSDFYKKVTQCTIATNATNGTNHLLTVDAMKIRQFPFH